MESLFPACLRHINAAIEPEILIEAFGKVEHSPYMLANIPLDHHIERDVILGQVVKDVQLFDSTEVNISLSGLRMIPVSNTHSTIFIPEGRRGGRDIMSAQGIVYGSNMGYPGSIGRGGSIATQNTITSASGSMLNALSGVSSNSEHEVDLYAPNVILVNNKLSNYGDGVLIANLSVDNRLSHIRNTTSLPFIELVIWKTKQMAYTRLNIKIGRNMVNKGKELGVFADVLREYRDARETYNELLTKFRVTVVLADPNKRRAIIRARMPRLLG